MPCSAIKANTSRRVSAITSQSRPGCAAQRVAPRMEGPAPEASADGVGGSSRRQDPLGRSAFPALLSGTGPDGRLGDLPADLDVDEAAGRRGQVVEHFFVEVDD